MNVFVHSSALKYFKNGNLWRHLSTSEADRDIPRVFRRKFNSEHVFEAFLLIDHYFLLHFIQSEPLFAI